METEPTSTKADIVKRLVTPVALWAVNRVLDLPRMKKRSANLERLANQKKKNALRSLRNGARNAASNRMWLAAGAVAFALGIGLMAKAARAK